MKKLLLSLFFAASMNVSFGATHLILTVGNTFSPNVVNAAVGDTVAFGITSGHNATSVTSGAWAANQSSPTTGEFAFSSSNAYIIPAGAAGTTIYYVCTIHVGSSGMKGQINVAPLSTPEVATEDWSMSAYPNPAENFINLTTTGVNGKMNVRVVNLLGAEVLPMATVDASTYRINLNALSEGTYFIRVESGNQTKVIRFMKK